MTRARLSVRVSALIAALLAVGPLLIIASYAAVEIQRSDLTNSVFLVAEDQAQTVADSLQTADPAINQFLGGEETVVQVVDSAGQVVESSTAVRGRAALAAAPPSGQTARSTATGIGENEEFAVVAIDVPEADKYVVVARSLEGVTEATSSTTQILLVGIPLILAIFAGLSWWLTGRALRPVEALRSRASEITATGGDARLPEGPTSNEIGRLSRTLNQMLDRLDANVVSQRQFVADASHELRSPIASIRTVMEVADPEKTTDWAEVRDDVLTETQRLERLVNQLLYLARNDLQQSSGYPGTDERMPSSLVDLVLEEAQRHRMMPVSIDVRSDPMVRADSASIGAILGNLLDNAARHARSSITLAVDEADGAATVSVEDDGDGISAADRERVFARFVRLDDARDRDAGGSGLGLAIARGVANRLGGALDLDVSAGPGARFVLTLPVAQD